MYRSLGSLRAGGVLALALLLGGLLFSSACAKPKAAVTHRGVGVVVEINTAKSRVKIDHEAIEGWMEAMKMWFDVKDAKMLEGLAPNDKVEFVVTEEESSDVITEIRKIG